MSRVHHNIASGFSALSGNLYVLTGALLWSTGGAGIKLISGLSPLAIAGGRSLVCAVFFAALLRGRVMPKGRFSLIAAGALAYAGVVIGFVVSTRFTTAANTIILQYTSLIWVIVLGWLFLKERAQTHEIIAVAIGLAGVVLCAGGGFSLWRSTGVLSLASLGDGLALFSGLCFALTTLALRRLRSAASASEEQPGDYAALVTLFFGNTLAAVVGLPSLLRDLQTPVAGQSVGLWIVAWLGIAQLGGGYWFFQRGLKTTRALSANLISLVEPLLNPLWVALFVGETPSRETTAGGLLILGAIVLTFGLRPRQLK